MATVFNFVGKLSLPKEKENFKPIDRREFSSGWTNTTVKFTCISGMNRVMLMCQGGKWTNDSKNTVKTFSKSTTDANGKVTKGAAIDIPWTKRFDKDQIEKVAGFKKFVVDTGDYKMRYKLQDLVDAFKNGTVTDEQMEQFDIYNVEDASVALEKSQAKRKEFISEWDFAEFVVKLVSSDKYKDKLFNISGNYDVQYSADKNRFYKNYHVNRITLAADDVEPKTEMKLDYYFGENAWDDNSYDETGKILINGWIDYYDSNLKKRGFCDIPVVIRESDDKKRNALKRKFTCDDGIKQIGLTLSVIEGAEKVELTVDMLSDDDRDDLECGLVEWDDLRKAYGGSVVGDKVSELRFASLTAKKNVAQDTVYTADDMHPAKADMVEEAPFDIFDGSDDEEDDL